MARKFFSGSTLEQAVLAAARHYEAEPERVAYQEREKKHGFLNVRRKFVIEVDPAQPLRPDGEEVPWKPNLAGVDHPLFDGSPSPSVAAEETQDDDDGAAPESRDASSDDASARQAEGDHRGTRGRGDRGGRHRHDRDDRSRGRQGGRSGEDRNHDRRDDGGRGGNRQDDDQFTWITAEEVGGDIPQMDDPLDAVDDSLGEIADFLFYDMQWEIRQEDDESVLVDLSGDDGDRIVAREAEVMRAIEHLLPRFVRSRFGETLHISVDCDGYQARHEESVQARARQIADEVRRSREAQLLEPMPPADRRLVHISLADDPSVVTESEGYGFTKRVRVAPA